MFKPGIIPKLKKKRKCSVRGCNSNSQSHQNIRFHSFPAPKIRSVFLTDHFGNKYKIDHREAWKKILKIKSVDPEMKICSLHFEKDDYLFPGEYCLEYKLST